MSPLRDFQEDERGIETGRDKEGGWRGGEGREGWRETETETETKTEGGREDRGSEGGSEGEGASLSEEGREGGREGESEGGREGKRMRESCFEAEREYAFVRCVSVFRPGTHKAWPKASRPGQACYDRIAPLPCAPALPRPLPPVTV